MNLNIDKSNTFYQTTDGSQQTAWTYSNFKQNSWNNIVANITCIDQVNDKMITFAIEACVKRGASNAYLAGTQSIIISPIGDSDLSDVTAAIETIGSSVAIDITGLADLTLDWSIQVEIDKITQN